MTTSLRSVSSMFVQRSITGGWMQSPTKKPPALGRGRVESLSIFWKVEYALGVSPADDLSVLAVKLVAAEVRGEEHARVR